MVFRVSDVHQIKGHICSTLPLPICILHGFTKRRFPANPSYLCIAYHAPRTESLHTTQAISILAILINRCLFSTPHDYATFTSLHGKRMRSSSFHRPTICCKHGWPVCHVLNILLRSTVYVLRTSWSLITLADAVINLFAAYTAAATHNAFQWAKQTPEIAHSPLDLGISIASAVFARVTHVTNRQTMHATPSVAIGHILLLLRCGLKLQLLVKL